jgi:hypothetical protein
MKRLSRLMAAVSLVMILAGGCKKASESMKTNDTNVYLEGGYTSQNAWNERKNLALAGDELPDMLTGGITDNYIKIRQTAYDRFEAAQR